MADEFRYAQSAAALSDVVCRFLEPKYTPLVEQVAGLFAFRDHDLEDFLGHLNTGGSCNCTDALFNTAVGFPGTQPAITTGVGNVAMGAQANAAQAAGNYSVAIGVASGGVGDADDNTSVGALALGDNTGNDNVGIGFNAGATGAHSDTTLVGSGAWGNGDFGVAIGSGAGIANGSLAVAGAVVVGAGGGVQNPNGIAIGFGSGVFNDGVDNDGGIAIGGGASTRQDGSVAIGKGVTANREGAVVIGVDSLGAPAGPAEPDTVTLGTGRSFLQCGDPGSGKGSWQLGTVLAAAVALDATQYVEVTIDGVVVKLAIVT